VRNPANCNPHHMPLWLPAGVQTVHGVLPFIESFENSQHLSGVRSFIELTSLLQVPAFLQRHPQGLPETL
jgi:hypothetical protein